MYRQFQSITSQIFNEYSSCHFGMCETDMWLDLHEILYLTLILQLLSVILSKWLNYLISRVYSIDGQLGST